MVQSTFLSNQAAGNGGAVYAAEDDYTSSISHCRFEQNAAGTDGSGSGGAVWTSQRRVEIDAARIWQNNTAASDGGGVYVADGFLAMTDSLVASNTATSGNGGGIYVDASAELNFTNGTVSGNTAQQAGGGFYFNGVTNTVWLVNATVAANRAVAAGTKGHCGGGIYTSSPEILLQNTIIAYNVRGAGTTPSEIEGLVDPNSSYTLVCDPGSAGGLFDGVNHSRVGVDPLLGPLQDNGGWSYTHALLPGSPAIDAGDNSLALAPDGEPLWYDQRRWELGQFDRLVGLYVDMGAYEYQQPGGQIQGRKWFDLNQDGSPDDAWGLSIVVNGGFEQGTFGTGSFVTLNAGSTAMTGWTILGAVDNMGTYMQPAEASRSIDLNATDAGAIAQTLVTEPGRRYRVQFAMAGNPCGYPGPKTLCVSAAGTSQDFTFDTTGHDASDMGWETKTWEFVAQNAMTTLSFESLTTHTAYGPAIDNVVVQPLVFGDVRIYLDQNGSGTFDPGEPLTFLRHDDPTTPAVDETGTYRFTGLPPGDYTVRETLAAGFQEIAPPRRGRTRSPLPARKSTRASTSATAGRRDPRHQVHRPEQQRHPRPQPLAGHLAHRSDGAGRVEHSARNAGFSVPDQNGDGKADQCSMPKSTRC